MTQTEMQNVGWRAQHGFKRVEGYDDEGDALVIWRKSEKDSIVYGMWPDFGDKNPYIINLAYYGFTPTKRL